jgi:hypothetical protein
MTFTQLRDDIADRLNLTSGAALERIERAVNRAYREVTASVSITEVTRRVAVTADTTEGVADVTFNGLEKVLSVWDPSSGSNRVLTQVLPGELLAGAPQAGDALARYAITRMNAGSVTVTLDSLPQTVFTLHAEGIERADVLSGSQEPAFPESFHDVLVERVLIDEYLKIEKPALSDRAKQTYEQRMGQLRLFIATSRNLKVRQNDRPHGGVGGGGGGGTAPNGGTSYTQTGLITFDRDPSAPFAVLAGSAVVPNLDADKLDGEDGDFYTNASNLDAGTIPDGRFPATLPVASGANLTDLNATALAAGTVPDARFPATLPAVSGANLTALNAAALASGTVPDARFPATLPVASGANLTALNASNLASGTIPSGRFPAIVPAEGISFPATQVPSAGANVLDDYEEGSWTPVLGGSGGTSGQTYSLQLGRYIKVGKKVTAWGRITLSAKGTITSDLQIQGLPFVSDNVTNLSHSSHAIYWSAMASSLVTLMGLMPANVSVVALFGATAAATGLSSLATADVGNSTALIFSITYQASA